MPNLASQSSRATSHRMGLAPERSVRRVGRGRFQAWRQHQGREHTRRRGVYTRTHSPPQVIEHAEAAPFPFSTYLASGARDEPTGARQDGPGGQPQALPIQCRGADRCYADQTSFWNENHAMPRSRSPHTAGGCPPGGTAQGNHVWAYAHVAAWPDQVLAAFCDCVSLAERLGR